MSFKRQPSSSNGFIYILSNPSMPNLYKVGFTTTSLKQRIQELNTTGVPRPFQAEKVFEIPESNLRAVEQLAHKKLKKKDLHHGKEFFEGSLHDCVSAVEDAIYEITKSESIDLIGHAKQRAAQEQRRKEDEKRRIELERKQLAELEERIRIANREVDKKRLDYIMHLKEEEKKSEALWVRFITLPFGILFFGAIGIAIMSEGGPLAWIGVPALVWWIFNKDKNEERERHSNAAASKYPYVTTQTINSHQATSKPKLSPSTHSSNTNLLSNTDNRQESRQSTTEIQSTTKLALEKRNAEINNTVEIEPVDWITDSKQAWLYNNKTQELLSTKSGLGFSIKDQYFILNNLSTPRKLNIHKTHVDNEAIEFIIKCRSKS